MSGADKELRLLRELVRSIRLDGLRELLGVQFRQSLEKP